MWPLTPQLWQVVFCLGNKSPLGCAFLPHLIYFPCCLKAFNFALIPVNSFDEAWWGFLFETLRERVLDSQKARAWEQELRAKDQKLNNKNQRIRARRQRTRAKRQRAIVKS